MDLTQLLGGAVFIFLAIAILYFIFWGMQLIKAAKNKKWVWFWLILIVPGISIIYWIVDKF